MMLLGIVLHSAIFTAIYAPIRTSSEESFFYLVYDFIHTFRMPAFFFISGFFSALIVDRRSVAGLISNRAKRILLPLIIFWPLTVAAFQMIFALVTNGNVAPAEQEFIEFYHLWFLAYLMYLNLISIFIMKLLPGLFLRPVKLLSNKVFQLALYILATFLLAAIPFTLEPDGTLKTASAVAPDNSMIAFYLIIFLLGWLSYQNRSMLENFRKFFYLFLIIGFLFYYVHLATSEQLDFDYRVVYFGASLSLSFGILGLLMNLISGHNRTISYLSQASYWLYIVHLPIVFLVLTLIDNYPLSMGLRFLFVLSITILISVSSYHLLVRHKPIGRLLGEKAS
jgi:glucan biosynthesis protein C